MHAPGRHHDSQFRFVVSATFKYSVRRTETGLLRSRLHLKLLNRVYDAGEASCDLTGRQLALTTIRGSQRRLADIC